MKEIVDILSNSLQHLLVTGACCFILTVFFGVRWEKSGKTEASRKGYLIGLCKTFAALTTASVIASVLSIIIKFLRAI